MTPKRSTPRWATGTSPSSCPPSSANGSSTRPTRHDRLRLWRLPARPVRPYLNHGPVPRPRAHTTWRGASLSAVSQGGELSVSRVFDAPRELVYRAFVDPDQLCLWFGAP